jgi:uncharacterized protein (DUF433 family)
MDDQLRQRIAVDPRVMVGKPVFRGTRIPVALVVRMLAQGIPETEILREYPRLGHEDLRAALAYAAQVLDDEVAKAVLDQYADRLPGCFVVASERGIRVRKRTRTDTPLQ